MNKDTAHIIDLPKIIDPRGNLSFLEMEGKIPFPIERIYWIYDVPGGEFRGGHAFHETEEIIIALSGSFDALIHDGETETRFSLNRSYYGLYVPQMQWRSLENFSTNSLALVIASTPYRVEDYIRDFDHFRSLKSGLQ